jgi:myo-inositol-1(or 4)-monophosphatase
LDIALSAALAGAEVVRSWFGRVQRADFKGKVDPVTVADREAEDAIVETIRAAHPDDSLLAEEAGASGSAAGRRWIIDPLDGTVNFIHGVPHVGVSVALYDERGPLVAVVVDVFRREIFRARAGGGAYLEDRPIHVSARTELGRSLIVTGFPYDRQDHASVYAATLAAVLARARGVRRVGSAALDFAYVAAGRYDGYWEFSLAPWDLAAGLLLVREAGGVATDHRGKPLGLDGRVVVAGNPEVAGQLRQAIADHIPAHVL